VGHITIPVAPISGPPTVRRDPISELTAIPLGEPQKLSCCFVSLILVRGDEIRALAGYATRTPQRPTCSSQSAMSTIGFHHLIRRLGEAAGMPFKVHPHMLRHCLRL
jgi:hypothetical protein